MKARATAMAAFMRRCLPAELRSSRPCCGQARCASRRTAPARSAPRNSSPPRAKRAPRGAAIGATGCLPCAPEQLDNRIGTFQIVDGTVTTATLYKGRAYINFGADYRKDFTVTVSPQDMKLFRQARFDVRKLAGQRVRVRGWVEQYNGPE